MPAQPQAHERSSLVPRDERYGWAMIGSVIFHVLLFAGMFVGSLSGGCQGKADTSQKPIAAKLVRLGTPRNERHLPRIPTAPAPPVKTREAPVASPGQQKPPPPTPTPPPPTPTPTPTPASTPKPVVATEPAKPAAPQAEAPKAPSSKDRLDDIMKRFAAGAREGPAEELPGQLDGDPMGDAEEAAEGERYLALVEQRLKSHYVIPSAIPDAERIRLVAIVNLRVERDGRISNFAIVERSGNGLFDSALEAAVQRASPLPPPPAHLLQHLRSLNVRFKL